MDKQFASTKNILEHLLTQEDELYDKAHKNFKVQIEEDILVGINHKIAELSKMDILEVYEKFESKEKIESKEKFAIALENAGGLFDISSSQLEKKGIKLKDDNEYLERMLNECKSIWNMIPSEYLSANEKYKFSEIRKKYLMNSEIISQLKKEQFDSVSFPIQLFSAVCKAYLILFDAKLTISGETLEKQQNCAIIFLIIMFNGEVLCQLVMISSGSFLLIKR